MQLMSVSYVIGPLYGFSFVLFIGQLYYRCRLNNDMKEFKLDPRLERDCIILGELNNNLLLLMNNSLVPWFVLVPKVLEMELIDLPDDKQVSVLQDINVLSAFLRNNFDISKLNIAAIGNVVSQLHIHIVGRSPKDYCWPNVVWGVKECQPYSEKRINNIVKQISIELGDKISLFGIVKRN